MHDLGPPRRVMRGSKSILTQSTADVTDINRKNRDGISGNTLLYLD
jgi:hypothetical protein